MWRWANGNSSGGATAAEFVPLVVKEPRVSTTCNDEVQERIPILEATLTSGCVVRAFDRMTAEQLQAVVAALKEDSRC